MFLIRRFSAASDGQTVVLSASVRIFSVAPSGCATITHRVPGIPVLVPSFIPVHA